jgi:hypothetical protein
VAIPSVAATDVLTIGAGFGAALPRNGEWIPVHRSEGFATAKADTMIGLENENLGGAATPV